MRSSRSPSAPPSGRESAWRFFARHDNPYVRVYAARAAAAIDDVDTLLRLAADPDDNVVEAALPPIRRRRGSESDAVSSKRSIAGPARPDAPLPRVPTRWSAQAALQLKGADSDSGLLSAVIGALQRITEERCQTSRDARLALIDRLAEFGSSAQAAVLTPLLRDIDSRVAVAAASVLDTMDGPSPYRGATGPPARIYRSSASLREKVNVKIEMESGKTFCMGFHDEQAPLTKDRFIRLVRANYYDNTPFHRVVSNFVIQGGSPNANEYLRRLPLHA